LNKKKSLDLQRLPYFHKGHLKNSWESHHGEGCQWLHHFEEGVCSLHGLLMMPVAG
jgi:hypothetical protein